MCVLEGVLELHIEFAVLKVCIQCSPLLHNLANKWNLFFQSVTVTLNIQFSILLYVVFYKCNLNPNVSLALA